MDRDDESGDAGRLARLRAGNSESAPPTSPTATKARSTARASASVTERGRAATPRGHTATARPAPMERLSRATA
jgi:hypothetical protein